MFRFLENLQSTGESTGTLLSRGTEENMQITNNDKYCLKISYIKTMRDWEKAKRKKKKVKRKRN